MIPRHPLTWPDGWKRSSSRKTAQFKTHGVRLSIFEGYKRVLDELERLRVRQDDVVVSTNVRTRLDGIPRSDQAEPSDPGVAVYWETAEKGTRVIAIDAYDRVADNLGAIAATLEALRAVERHGGAAILERTFTGFDALPPPKSPFEVLGIAPSSGEDMVQLAYKQLVRKRHPDVPGGSHNLMSELNWARDDALKIIGARQQ